MKLILRFKGGPGSGDFGHSGRKGMVGGSSGGSGKDIENVDLSNIDLNFVEQEYSDKTKDVLYEYSMGYGSKEDLIRRFKREPYARDRLREQLRTIADKDGYVSVYRGGEEEDTISNGSLSKNTAQIYATGFTGIGEGQLHEYKVPINNFIGIGNAGEFEIFFTNNSRVKRLT